MCVCFSRRESLERERQAAKAKRWEEGGREGATFHFLWSDAPGVSVMSSQLLFAGAVGLAVLRQRRVQKARVVLNAPGAVNDKETIGGRGCLESTRLSNNLRVSRLTLGLWQVADLERPGGIGLETEVALAAIGDHVAAGISNLDMADHYGSAELLAGEFLRRQRTSQAESTRGRSQGAVTTTAFTKWCPKPGPGNASAEAVDSAVQTALERLALPEVRL